LMVVWAIAESIRCIC